MTTPTANFTNFNRTYYAGI